MASYKSAVHKMCKSCIYDPRSTGTWRKQVENCTSYECALYRVRPVSNYADTVEEIAENEAQTTD